MTEPTVYRHVRLQAGPTTLIGYVTDHPTLHPGAHLTLKHHNPDLAWEIKYVGITRTDVAGLSHTWDTDAVWEAKPYRLGGGVSGTWCRFPPPDVEEAA